MSARSKWDRWAETVDWAATYTCKRCGQVGQGYYVQPQPPWTGGGALCSDCITEINRQIREERKRQLAAMPRCEVPGCKRRATHCHNGTGLCGQHFWRANETVLAKMGGFALLAAPVVLDREELIDAALGR
ncbi:MAG: hypothetical protein AB1816_11160 [Bacillota bacterium]